MNKVLLLYVLCFYHLSIIDGFNARTNIHNDPAKVEGDFSRLTTGVGEEPENLVYGDVKFYLYNRYLKNGPEVYAINGSFNHPSIFKHFSLRSETKIIIHGWQDDVNGRINVLLRNAYLAHYDYNVIVVDWSAAGSKARPYWRSRKQVASVAGQVATFIDRLCGRFRLRPERLHLIGHSLGAHIAGLVYHNLTSGSVGRVTGLDPARPGFDFRRPEERINENSGLFVDVIHTSGGFLAGIYPMGQVDFFPNSGRLIQPGCGLDIEGVSCSHARAFLYYAESIENPKGFLSTPCQDWTHYEKGECDKGETKVVMGNFTPKSAKGNYYLRTNTKAPFSKDESTIKL